MMLRLLSLSCSSDPYNVVLLPEPVGPVTSRIPCGRSIVSLRISSVCGDMPS